MADTKISDLTAASSLSDAHELPVVESGANKKVTGAQIKNHTHTKSQISDFTHTHVQADITDFTHTHTASAITDFGEAVDDRIATTIVAGTNLTGTYNDGANTLTLDVDTHTHTASQVSDFSEAVDDRVAGLLTEGSGISLTYNDGANTLEIAADALGSHTHTASDVTDFGEAVDDEVNGLIIAGDGITKAYNDLAGTLTLTADLSGTGTSILVGDGSADATSEIETFLAAGVAGQRLFLRGKFLTNSPIEMTDLSDFTIDAREADFYRNTHTLQNMVEMDSCRNIHWEGGTFRGYRATTFNGSASDDENGSSTSGTTRILNADDDKLRLAINNDTSEAGVGFYPFYLLEQFPNDVQTLITAYDPTFIEGAAFELTLKDSAQVASDCIITIEAKRQKKDGTTDVSLGAALGSGDTTYIGELTTETDLFGAEKWQAKPGDYLRIDNEIILISDWAGSNNLGTSTWTLARGQLGTTAASHAVGADVYRVLASRTLTLTASDTAYILPYKADHRFEKYSCYVRKMTSTANTITLTSYRIFGGNWYSASLAEGANGIDVDNCQDCTFDDQRFEGMQSDAYHVSGRDSHNNRFRGFQGWSAARQGLSVTAGRKTFFEHGLVVGSARTGIDIEPSINNAAVEDLYVRDTEVYHSGNFGFSSGENNSTQVTGVNLDGVTIVNGSNGGFLIGGRDVVARDLVCRGRTSSRNSMTVWATNFYISDCDFDSSMEIEAQTGLKNWHDFTALASDDTITIGDPVANGPTSASSIDSGFKVIFRGASLPTGISAYTTYYVRDWEDDPEPHFKVATTLNGTAVNLSADGSGQVMLANFDAMAEKTRVKGRLVNISHGREMIDVDPNAEVEMINVRTKRMTYSEKTATSSEYGKDFFPYSVSRMAGFTAGMERDYFPRSYGADYMVGHDIQGLNALGLGGGPIMAFSGLTSRARTGTLFSSASRTGAQSAIVDLGADDTHGKIRIKVYRTSGSGYIVPEVHTSIDGVYYRLMARMRTLTTATATEPDAAWFYADVRRFVKVECNCIDASATFGVDYEFWPAGNNFALAQQTVAEAATTKAVTFPSWEIPLIRVSGTSGATVTGGTLNPATTYYYRAGHRTWDRGPSQWAAEVSRAPGGSNNAVDLDLENFLQRNWVTTGVWAKHVTILRGTSTGNYDTRYDMLSPNPFGRIIYGSDTTVTDTGTSLTVTNNQQWRDWIASDAVAGSYTATDQSGWEPDTNYEVMVAGLTWGTTWHVTSKTRAGFTLNFGTAAPGGGGTVMPVIVR